MPPTLDGLVTMSGKQLFLCMFLPVVMTVLVVVIIILALELGKARRDGS